VPAFAVSKPVAKVAKAAPAKATPIQYLVVIFQEHVSFDHYFGTYPHATNPPGEPKFTAALHPDRKRPHQCSSDLQSEPQSRQRRRRTLSMSRHS
jgi:phospholipase C